MKEEDKTREQLIDELMETRRRNEALREREETLRQKVDELSALNEELRETEAELERRNRELAALNTVTRLVNSSLDMEETLISVSDEVIAVLDTTRCSVYLVDENLEYFTEMAASFRGKPSGAAMQMRREALSPLNRRMVRERTPVVTHGGDDPQFAPEERRWAESYGIRATLGVPIVIRDRAIGYFVAVEQDRSRRFSADEISLCRAIADQVGVAIENARLYAAHVRSEEELERHAAELERSNQELEQFAYIASHDLQEPLRKIQAFGDRLRSRYGEVLDERGRDYLERMGNAAGRMRNLINDLLTFSRVTTRAQPFTEVGLTKVVREAVSDLETRIRETGGRVEVGELPTLDADSTQMRQLFQNLIGNALKFHRAGESPVVRVRGRVEGGEAEVVVEDNGIGFDEKYVDRIFGVFQRLHGRTEYAGTGVGLAICRKVVERHGGRIAVRSTPGKGSTFVVTLPVKQPKRGEAQ